MKNKKVSTNDETIVKVTGRMIGLCWIILLCCFAIKLFGGNFFEIIYRSEFYERIASNAILLKCAQIITHFTGTYMLLMITYKEKYKWLCILSAIIIFFSNYLGEIGATIVELCLLIVLPICLKIKWYRPIIVNILVICFQLISMYTKNINCMAFPSDNVIGIIFALDYYIMLMLFYLYDKKRRLTMGVWFMDWLHKDEAKYNAIKEKNVKKIEAHKTEITKLENENKLIDTKIAAIKAKKEKKEGK